MKDELIKVALSNQNPEQGKALLMAARKIVAAEAAAIDAAIKSLDIQAATTDTSDDEYVI